MGFLLPGLVRYPSKDLLKAAPLGNFPLGWYNCPTSAMKKLPHYPPFNRGFKCGGS